jgi:DNA topoisomerase-3
MPDQIVITEKSSPVKDVCVAISSRFGIVPPAVVHLSHFLEPEDAVLGWKRWTPILLRREEVCGTRR